MKSSFRTIALIGKYKSPEVAGPLLELARYLEGRKVKVLIDRLTATQVKDVRYSALALEEIGQQADLAIVIGGDGTMLNIARTFAPYNVALVGINQGRLGFLTDLSMNTMFEAMGSILDGSFITESRMLLQAAVLSGERQVLDVLAFNDVSVNKGAEGSLIEIEVRIDGQFVYNLRSDGLIVAVIKNADQKSLVGIARELEALGKKARDGKLTLDDVQGGTFTITNPGVFGSIWSMPIIVPGQAAILATDAIVERPVVRDDAIAIRDIMHLGLSFDHRIFDGAVADQFLSRIKAKLEGLPGGDAALTDF